MKTVLLTSIFAVIFLVSQAAFAGEQTEEQLDREIAATLMKYAGVMDNIDTDFYTSKELDGKTVNLKYTSKSVEAEIGGKSDMEYKLIRITKSDIDKSRGKFLIVYIEKSIDSSMSSGEAANKMGSHVSIKQIQSFNNATLSRISNGRYVLESVAPNSIKVKRKIVKTLKEFEKYYVEVL